MIMNEDTIRHYDTLIDENNDPVHDPEPLKAYMDKWDGNEFISKLGLNKKISVLEIGVGTGRLAIRTVPLCGSFFGIDISPKTIDRAKENLKQYDNVLHKNAGMETESFFETEYAYIFCAKRNRKEQL